MSFFTQPEIGNLDNRKQQLTADLNNMKFDF